MYRVRGASSSLKSYHPNYSNKQTKHFIAISVLNFYFFVNSSDLKPQNSINPTNQEQENATITTPGALRGQRRSTTRHHRSLSIFSLSLIGLLCFCPGPLEALQLSQSQSWSSQYSKVNDEPAQIRETFREKDQGFVGKYMSESFYRTGAKDDLVTLDFSVTNACVCWP